MSRFLLSASRMRLPRATTLLAWLLPVFAWAPLTSPGYLELHSGFLSIFNLNDLARHLTDLSWAATVGQPFDLWRGERVLPYLLATLPRLLGAAPADAVKLVLALGLVLGCVGMYAWARRHLGDWAGLTAAAIYTFLPIGLATVLVRGAFAEAALLALLPWTLWAADAASSRRLAALVLLAAALLWTQAGLALWWLAALMVYVNLPPSPLPFDRLRAGSARDGERQLPPLLPGAGGRGVRFARMAALVGGAALGALGLAPVIVRHGLGGGNWLRFTEHLVYPHQLLLAGWGSGPSIPGPDDTLTFSLGLVACGLGVLGVLGIRYWVLKEEYPIPYTQYLALAFTATFALASTTLAAPIWQFMPGLARTLTTPWQLLLLAGPWLAWLAGAGARALLAWLPAGEGDGAAPALAGALLALALLGVYGDLSPRTSAAAPPNAPLAVFGADEIALLDVTPLGAPGPGGIVAVQVRWQALRPLAQDYTIFFHVLGPDGAKLGQQDTMPQGGARPTSRWRPGEVVTDRYEAPLPPNAPLGPGYRYLLGLYAWQSGQRLPAGTDDKVVVTP